MPCCCLCCFHFFGVTWLLHATCFHPELCAHYISQHPRRFCMRKLETHAQQRSAHIHTHTHSRYLSGGRHKQSSNPWLTTSRLTPCTHPPGGGRQGTAFGVTLTSPVDPSYCPRHPSKDLLHVLLGSAPRPHPSGPADTKPCWRISARCQAMGTAPALHVFCFLSALSALFFPKAAGLRGCRRWHRTASLPSL